MVSMPQMSFFIYLWKWQSQSADKELRRKLANWTVKWPAFFEFSQFLFKWIFLVPIELIRNPKNVQIVILCFYWPEFWRKILAPLYYQCLCHSLMPVFPYIFVWLSWIQIYCIIHHCICTISLCLYFLLNRWAYYMDTVHK